MFTQKPIIKTGERAQAWLFGLMMWCPSLILWTDEEVEGAGYDMAAEGVLSKDEDAVEVKRWLASCNHPRGAELGALTRNCLEPDHSLEHPPHGLYHS